MTQEEQNKKIRAYLDVCLQWDPKVISLCRSIEELHNQVCELAGIERELEAAYEKLDDPKPDFSLTRPIQIDLWRIEILLQEAFNTAVARAAKVDRERLVAAGIPKNTKWGDQFEGKGKFAATE